MSHNTDGFVDMALACFGQFLFVAIFAFCLFGIREFKTRRKKQKLQNARKKLDVYCPGTIHGTQSDGYEKGAVQTAKALSAENKAATKHRIICPQCGVERLSLKTPCKICNYPPTISADDAMNKESHLQSSEGQQSQKHPITAKINMPIVRRLSILIELFGGLYILYWLLDTIILCGLVPGIEGTVEAYLYFCLRGVLGVTLIFLANRIRSYPRNTTRLLGVVCVLLLFRGLTMGADRDFGGTNFPFLVFNIKESSSSHAYGMGPLMLLLIYTWRKRRELILSSVDEVGFVAHAEAQKTPVTEHLDLLASNNPQNSDQSAAIWVKRAIIISLSIIAALSLSIALLFYLSKAFHPVDISSRNVSVIQKKDVENNDTSHARTNIDSKQVDGTIVASKPEGNGSNVSERSFVLPSAYWSEKARADVQIDRPNVSTEQPRSSVQTPKSTIDAFNKSLSGQQDLTTGLKPFQIAKAITGLAMLLLTTEMQRDGFADSFFKDPTVIVENAIQGDASAQMRLGMMYAFGHMVPQENETTRVWYRYAAYNAASTKEHKAIFASILAGFYCFPFGEQTTDRNYPEAFRLWHAAAKDGHCVAAGCVGWCYYLGQGTSKDIIEALSWFYVAKGLDNGTLAEDDVMGAMIEGNDWTTVIDRMEKRVGEQGTLVAQQRAAATIRRIQKLGYSENIGR